MLNKAGNLNAEMLRLRQLQQAEALKPRPASAPRVEDDGPSFEQVLQDKISANDVRFSAHAVSRLIDRDISLTKTELDRLRDGVKQVADKGSKESLVMMEDMAFVVSVKNRTVITAMTGETVKNNVFTNIDSAVIV